jgi:hypothetical protein
LLLQQLAWFRQRWRRPVAAATAVVVDFTAAVVDFTAVADFAAAVVDFAAEVASVERASPRAPLD